MALLYENTKEVYHHKTFYSYDDELYAKCFPIEWARNHCPGTGPKDCKDCVKNGCWNGVFVGYCVKCANVYEIIAQISEYDIEGGGRVQPIYKYKYNPTTQEMDYCFNEEEQEQKGRGCGFDRGILDGENTWIDNPKAAMNTYLANVKLDDIGDKDMFDSALECGSHDGCPFTLYEVQQMKEMLKKKMD